MAKPTVTHTPGPWEAIPGGIVRTAGTQQLVADTYARGSGDWRPMAHMEADARLMAAAPDLFTVLREVEWAGLAEHSEGGYYRACPHCGGGDPDDPVTQAGYAGHVDGCDLDDAIAKAEGRSS